MPTQIQIARTAPFLGWLLRAMTRRIPRGSLPADRNRGLETEVQENLYPMALASENTPQFVREYARRFEVNLVGGSYTGGDGHEHSAAPLYILIPRKYAVLANLPEMEHERARERPDLACIRWDHVIKAVDFDAMRILIFNNPAQWATFAFTDDAPDDETLFDIDASGPELPPLTFPLPERLISPRAFRSLWVLTSNLAHGGDFKMGNVVTFRRELKIDPTTGQQTLVPLLSANAVRGLLRDIAGGLLCQALEVKARDLPPTVAHALFAGGTLVQGSDNGGVDLSLRHRLRKMLPCWDVFGGVWGKTNIMPGVLQMHDPIIVCQETAWLTYHELAPKVDGERIPFEEYKARLLRADKLTQLRLGTRHAHRELEESDGYQMIYNVEHVKAGTHVLSSFSIQNIDGVDELSRSFMAYLMDEFRARGLTGASQARGMGQIAFDPYIPNPGELPLPSPAIYTGWMEEHRAEVLDLLMTGGKGSAAAVAASPVPAAKGKGRGKRAAAVDVDAEEPGL